MKTGDIRTEGAALKGIKVSAILLRENELRIALKGRGKTGTFALNLKGIIAFKDEGVHGKPLADYTIEDKGSFREIRFNRTTGETLFRCEYMEGEITG